MALLFGEFDPTVFFFDAEGFEVGVGDDYFIRIG